MSFRDIGYGGRPGYHWIALDELYNIGSGTAGCFSLKQGEKHCRSLGYAEPVSPDQHLIRMIEF